MLNSGTREVPLIPEIDFYPSRFLDRMKGFLKRHHLCYKGDKILVALSGGQDSVCMLHLFKCLSFSWDLIVFAAHFEHGLRGDESLRDAEFTLSLAKSWNVNFFLERGDVKRFAEEKKISTQEAARILRYRFLEDVRQKSGATSIATAHTETDQAEELLMRLIRGAGLSGMSGIPLRNGFIIRPLLWARREDISSYVERMKLPFVSDSSNDNNHYLRNRVRHDLLPYIRENYNPSIEKTLGRTANVLSVENDSLDKIARRAYSASIRKKKDNQSNKEFFLDITNLTDLEEAVRCRVIKIFLGNAGVPAGKISSWHIDAIDNQVLNYVDRRFGEIYVPGGLKVVLEGSRLYVYQNEGRHLKGKGTVQESESFSIPGLGVYPAPRGGNLKITLMDSKSDFEISRFFPKPLFFDANNLEFPVFFRYRQAGDRFRPLGFSEEVRLKKFLVNRKIPLDLRDRIPILTRLGTIIAVVGVELSDLCRLDSRENKRFIRMELTELTGLF